MEVIEFLKKALQSPDHRIHGMADADNVDAPYIHEDKLKSFSNTDYLISNFSKEILRGTCLLFENVCMYVQSICFCKTKILLLFYIYASLVPLFPP